jgi:hypothetical protein
MELRKRDKNADIIFFGSSAKITSNKVQIGDRITLRGPKCDFDVILNKIIKAGKFEGTLVDARWPLRENERPTNPIIFQEENIFVCGRPH